MNKEKIALLLAALLLGAMGYFSFPAQNVGRVSPNEKGIEIKKILLPDLDRIVQGKTSPGRARDVFAAPRDTSPLPPLGLPLPPGPKLPFLAPPIRPSVKLSLWDRAYRVPGEIRPFEFSSTPQESSIATKEPGKSEETKKDESRKDSYKKIYDWLRPNAFATLFGKIQNPNRFDLGSPKLREGESLLFQEIDPVTGKLKGKPTPWPPESVQEYGFADTIANRIELRKRTLSYSAGNLKEIVAFADWCVEQGGLEPKAFEEAERLYKKASELDRGDPAGVLGLGRLYERSFQLEQAYELYRSMAQGPFSHRSEPFRHLGKLQSRLRLFELAEASLRRALEIEGSSPSVRAALGEFYLDRERPETAAEILREAKLEPESPFERARMRTLTGSAWLAAGSWNEASAAFQQALNVVPQFGPARLGLASTRYAEGKIDAAMAEIEAGLAEGQLNTGFYTAHGILSMRRGDFAGAERDLKNAVGLDPLQDAYPLSALSFLYEYTGHPEEAFQAIEQANTVDPTDPYVRFQRARLLAAREDAKGARESVSLLLNSEIRFESGLRLRGFLAQQIGEYEDAERYFSLASEISPKDADLLTLRGLNLARGEQLRRAGELFAKALTANPLQASARNGLAYTHYLEGRVDEAIRTFAEVEDQHKEKDEHLEYAQWRSKEIQSHRKKALWTDDFERADLRRDWRDEARFGPLVRLEGGTVRFDGFSRESGRTRLYRELPAKAFLLFETGLTIEESNQALVGAHVVVEKKIGDSHRVEFEFAVARLRNGKVGTRMQTGQVETEWKEQEGISWPLGSPVRVGVERVGTPEEPKLRILFNGVVLGEAEKVLKLRSIAGEIRMGVFAEADAGRQVAARVDDTRVIFRED